MKGKLEWSVLEILIVRQLGRKIFVHEKIFCKVKRVNIILGERDQNITDVSSQ